MRAKQAARQGIDEDDVIDVDEPEEDELDADDEPPEPTGEHVSRADKKRNRYAEMRQELDDERRRRREVEEAAHQQRLQSLQQQQPQSDPLDVHLDRLQKEEIRFNKEYQARRQQGLSETEEQEYIERAQQIRNAIQQTNARIAQREQPTPQQISQHSAVQSRRQAFAAKHPDVFGHHDRVQVDGQNVSRAAYWANQRFQQLVTEGHPDNEATAEIAVQEARQRFLGKKTASDPTAARERFAGPPKGSNGQTENGRLRVVMHPHRKKLAEARYPDLPPEQAWQKWANSAGKRIVEKGR